MNRYPSYRGGGITGLPHYGKGGFFQGLKGGLWDLVKDVAPKALTYMNPWIGIPADILKNKVLEGKGWKDSLVGGAKNLMFDQALKAGMAKAGASAGGASDYAGEWDEDIFRAGFKGPPQSAVQSNLEMFKAMSPTERAKDPLMQQIFGGGSTDFGLGSILKNPSSIMDVFKGGVGYISDPENAALLSLIGELDNQRHAQQLGLDFARMRSGQIRPETAGSEGRAGSPRDIDSTAALPSTAQDYWQDISTADIRRANGGIIPGYDDGGEYSELLPFPGLSELEEFDQLHFKKKEGSEELEKILGRQGYADIRRAGGGLIPGYENGGEHDEPEDYYRPPTPQDKADAYAKAKAASEARERARRDANPERYNRTPDPEGDSLETRKRREEERIRSEAAYERQEQARRDAEAERARLEALRTSVPETMSNGPEGNGNGNGEPEVEPPYVPPTPDFTPHGGNGDDGNELSAEDKLQLQRENEARKKAEHEERQQAIRAEAEGARKRAEDIASRTATSEPPADGDRDPGDESPSTTRNRKEPEKDPYGPPLGPNPTQAQINERQRLIDEETRRQMNQPDPLKADPVGGDPPDPDADPTLDGFQDKKPGVEEPDPLEVKFTGPSGHGTDMGPGYNYPTFRKPIMPKTTRRKPGGEGSYTPDAEGYRAGFHSEDSRTTGGGGMIGADPFADLGSPDPVKNPRYADLVNRLEEPPIDRTPVATVAKGGMIPEYQEGGMTGTMPPELMNIAREALMNPSMESNEILQILAQQYPKEMASLMQQSGSTQQMNTGGIVTKGYIPEFADGGMESSGAVDDRVAVSKDDLVEEDFQKRLENGGPLDVVAALAPNEYIITAEQTTESDPQDMVQAAEAIPGDTPPGAAVWDSFTNNLDRVI